jgi:formylglycine-generating enzyme required for sulfatase activity
MAEGRLQDKSVIRHRQAGGIRRVNLARPGERTSWRNLPEKSAVHSFLQGSLCVRSNRIFFAQEFHCSTIIQIPIRDACEDFPMSLFSCHPCRSLAVLCAAVLLAGLALCQSDNKQKELPGTVKVDLGGGVTMEFVRIKAGKFRMGSPKSERYRGPDEEQHEVEITRDFYLGQYAVTQQQYEALMGTNPSWYSAKGEGKERVQGLATSCFPVENVSWEDAVRYCAKLTEKHGKGGRKFRLPTEAEWEYACRAGTETPFSFGASCNGTEANCGGDDPYGTSVKGPNLGRPCAVGSYRPNAWGLYDMHGNVWQWCQDWYGPYGDLGNKDPLRTDKIKDEGDRVVRGGCWMHEARCCRAAYRAMLLPRYRDSSVGFRVAFRLD